ncbi:MAG TPA: hypothetical protein VGB78_02665 [Thermoplasmata archaeon]
MRRRSLMFLVLGVAGLALYVFGEHSVYTLLAGSLGFIAMVVSYFSHYRPGAILGMLVVAVSAAVASPLETLTEVGAILTAVVGFFLPVAVCVWFALSTEVEEEPRLMHYRRPALLTAFYALLCLVSVPLAIRAISLFAPNVSVRFSVLEEVSVILMVASIGAVILSFREPRPATKIEETEKTS